MNEIQSNFREKVRLMIRSKVTKNQGFTISLENIVLEKPYGGGLKTLVSKLVSLQLKKHLQFHSVYDTINIPQSLIDFLLAEKISR